MARANIPFLAFNRGLLSPKALGRVDIDRTRLSAEVFTNWIGKTQGSMRIRPGTKYVGSSKSDTGAEFIEFVAATNDTALAELTHQKMRVWIASDTGRSTGALAFETPVSTGLDVALSRPKVDTTVTLSDTGWSNTSTGGIAAGQTQVSVTGGTLALDATAIGSLARREKRVIVSDTGTEHSLDINVSRGPVTLRVGSAQRNDDYISETQLGTGYHNLAFTPTGNFWVTVQTNAIVDKTVASLTIGDSGTVELTAPYSANDLTNIRYDQSADVVYLDCDGVPPYKIERRGTGRSWSIVKYQPDNGPFLSTASSSARLSVGGAGGGQLYGNTTVNSDIPFFDTGHDEGLIRLFHGSQSGTWPLGALNAVTDAIKVTGISDTGDTGTPSQGSERRITVSASGTYTGAIMIERSVEGPESGFHPISLSRGYIKGISSDPTGPFGGGGGTSASASDTGTFTKAINDPDDNTTAWYRFRMSSYTSGVAVITVAHPHGGVNGVGRITSFVSTTQCNIEVLSRFSDTGTTDVWQEGAWSGARKYPTVSALHSGRLFHAGNANLWGSVSDDYENFDDETEGDAAPLSRTLGSGPVDNVVYLLSLLRLIIGTSGAEMTLRSSSLDEPVTVTNSSVRGFSTNGSANIRSLKLDTSGIFVQRSGKRICLAGFGQGSDGFGDYDVSELTLLVPDLLDAGVVSIAVQRQPDTRIHCVLANGKVAILTYEPKEDVLCWSMWEGDTGTSPTVERAAVLPGTGEDRVYYHIRRTINGVTKRYLERWATEAESIGDTGLSWLADCAKSYTDTGRASSLTGFSHLAAESVVVWGDDTGQSVPGRDYSYDTGDVQKQYTVSGAGVITLAGTDTTHHAVAGLPYRADWKSTKLAYAAEAGSALAQMKRTDKIGLVLFETHNNGLFFGNDTGTLDALPRRHEGADVSPKHIYQTLDAVAMPFPGLWSTDSRIVLRAKSPRPAHVLAAIPTISTNEKV